MCCSLSSLQDVVCRPCETETFVSFVSADACLASAFVLSLLPLFGRARATGVTAGLMRGLLDDPGVVAEDVEGVLGCAVLSTAPAFTVSELLSPLKK